MTDEANVSTDQALALVMQAAVTQQILNSALIFELMRREGDRIGDRMAAARAVSENLSAFINRMNIPDLDQTIFETGKEQARRQIDRVGTVFLRRPETPSSR